MPMSSEEVKEVKAMLAVATKRPVNFGLCLGKEAAETVLILNRQKDGKALAELAKKAVGTTQTCFGSAALAGKTLTLTCEVKAPSGLAKALQVALKTHGLSLTIVLAKEGDGQALAPKKGASGVDTGAHPDKAKFDKAAAELAKLFDVSVSRLSEGPTLRATRDFALASAEERDYTAAFKSLEKVTADFDKALKAHGTALAQKFSKAYDEVKAGLSEESQKTLTQALKEGVTDLVGTKPPADIEAAVAKLIKALAVAVKTDKGKVQGAKEGLALDEKAIKDKATKEITALSKDVTALESQITKANKQLSTLRGSLNQKQKNNKKKFVLTGEARSKAQSDVVKLEKEIKTKKGEIEAKRLELQPLILQAQESRDTALKEVAEKMKALDDRIEKLVQSVPEMPFKEIHAALEETIREQAEAMEWREGKDGEGGEVRRNAEGEGHGSSRHGAQTGIERQARRAATGGVAPDGYGDNGQTDRLRGTGVTIRTTRWKEIDIEYEEVDGKKVVKSRKVVQKAILGEVANWTNLPSDNSSSVFANPVLEKLAVDTAIKRMTDKAWTQVHINGWQDLTSVAVFLGPPKDYGKPYKGWGYSLSRKEAGLASLNFANQVLDLFETGKITEKQMLTRLGVEYLMKDGTIAMVPYVRVVLQRDNVSSPWKSLTHFPDKAASAEDIKVQTTSVIGRNVRVGGKVQTASL
ncbi:hypothetical protein [Stagnihabitans tardus]|uniref:Uncharacterized protein n=1 Tax=Stagnihabitans tardus TaxID=2699202 RepID=A0AAE4Y5U7_9RHOB|nr:hypothetical protein [Stagnihabitans tardus]NBZ86311.1 hypothetical protein [Stagnihabitans tardus]